jgi:hypothetical protein
MAERAASLLAAVIFEDEKFVKEFERLCDEPAGSYPQQEVERYVRILAGAHLERAMRLFTAAHPTLISD